MVSCGLTDTGGILSAADAERIVRLVAHYAGAEVHAGAAAYQPNCQVVSGSKDYSESISQ